jgi:hypothetical protein
VAVAQLSFAANEQHNPGEPLHWAKEKSTDEQDAGMRHAIEPLLIGGSEYDGDGFAHKVKKAWRALAELQRFLEAGNVARAFTPGPGGIRIPSAGAEPMIAAGASRVPVCKECKRNIGTLHAPNCSHNFQKRAPHISTCENSVEPPQTFHFDGPPDFGLVGDLEIAAGGMVEIRACSECNYIAPSHRPNCSHNFQKRAPDRPLCSPSYESANREQNYQPVNVCTDPNCSCRRAPTICSDCGVDLDQNAHAAGCLRLNQPMV